MERQADRRGGRSHAHDLGPAGPNPTTGSAQPTSIVLVRDRRRPPGDGRPRGTVSPPARSDAAARQDPSGTDDAVLVDRMRAGDERALATIYDRHARAVLGLARQIVGDQARAEEVTQTVFLRIWQQPDRFDARRGSLRSFLLTITHTRAIDLIRSDRARTRREETDHRRGEPLSRASELDGWLAATQAHVREALLRLPEPERLPLVAAYYGGYTYQQVAEMLGQPEGTVKSRIRSGLQRLRLLLTEDGDG
jgi:RNA polymerase sigma-70 factor, ECF subfamily